MTEKKYEWLRFWAPRDGKVAVNGYGALEDPQGAYGHIVNPEAKTLEALADVRCLAMLGEPGSGKSEEFKRQVKAFSSANPSDAVLSFQLRDYQTDLKLCYDIFENNPKFKAWVQGDHALYLYLDSLDEGLLTISTLANLLVRELNRYPANRLYLRIACRTAEWPTTLTTGIQEHWGEEAFKAYELLPLRQKDIEEAVHSEGIDPRKFFEELARKQVGPLAIKPVTLKFLIGLFHKHGALPHTQAELYAEGCRYLCEEWNQSRRDSHRKGKLTTAQKFLVAQRIAAISIFANRNAVWMGPLPNLPAADVAIEGLTSGSEGSGSERFYVGEEEIRETVSTGLFNSRGPERMGWAHQTYAEFLAAQYLREHKFTFSQKIGLIAHPEDARGRIIPQLREAAAWLATTDKEAFDWVLKTDPVTLLRTDVVDSDDISALVNRLLQSANNEEWIDSDWSVHGSYSKLKHPGLADQLRPYIGDKRMGTFARRLATDIAEACEVRLLQGDLADLARDPEEDTHLRVNAAYAVVRIGDSQTKARLRLLATGEAGDDPDDELKGRGLRAIWPDHISSDELFSLLTHPKRPSLYGSYKSFLGELARESETIDLLAGLTWLRNQHTYSDPGSPFRSLSNEILRRAWQSAEVPAVTDVLADLILNNVRKLRGDDREKFEIDDGKRRAVLYRAIQRLAQAEKPSWYSLSYENRLVSAADLPWLVEQIRSEQSTPVQKLLSEIIARMLDWSNTEHVGLIIETSANCPVLAETFSLFLNPVYLDSEQADGQRKAYAKSLELNREVPESPSLDPPATERVLRALKEFEAGNSAAWWRLNIQMTVREDGFCDNEHESDLTNLAGWQAAPEIRNRVIEGAKKYLRDGDPEPNEWINKELMWRPAYAGYRAFRLLLHLDQDYLSSLPSSVWQKWACILVSYPFQNEQSDADIQAKLVALAYQHASAEVIRVVWLLIDKENKPDGFLSVLSVLRTCWDEPLCDALMLKVKHSRLKVSFVAQILSELLERDVKEAKRYAEGIVKRKPTSPVGEQRRLRVAQVLVTHAHDAGWKVVWPRIKQDPNFGRQLIESVAGSHYRRQTAIPERLNEEQLADLFFWLAREYPYIYDPRHEGMYSPGPDDEARRFRDSVLHHLKERSSARAIAALEMLVHRLPELEWLKWTLADAREINRRRTWAPVRPSDILNIAENEERRLVQSGEQLLDVVIESLRRLEEKLHGETPAAVDLWNEVKPGVYRPVTENDLSNYVKRHFDYDLKERGIIANREVQIRQSEGTFRGQNTDILIDALTRDARGEVFDQITLIVETKGCWNRGLDQAMDTQLKDRYLKDNQSQFGLYLVGWFSCAQWDDRDPRKKICAKTTKAEALRNLENQAATLSRGGAALRAFVLDTGLDGRLTAGDQ